MEKIEYESECLYKRIEELKKQLESDEDNSENVGQDKDPKQEIEEALKKLEQFKVDKKANRLKELTRDANLITGNDNLFSNSTDFKIKSREESIRIIANDIPRTFSKDHVFKSEVYSETLQKVLEAFAMYRPDIGYVQGMSYICGIVCLLTNTEYAAFILFHNIVTKSNLFPFYRFDDTYMKQRIVIFKQIFGYNLQDLCFHFEDEGIQPNLYLYEWFMSLFAKALNMDIVCRVWDLIFLDGMSILYKTAIVILSTLEEQLMESEFDEIMQILRNTSNLITDEDEFIDAVVKTSLPHWIDVELPILEKDQLPAELL